MLLRVMSSVNILSHDLHELLELPDLPLDSRAVVCVRKGILVLQNKLEKY
jgi:hypothetical protein